MNCNDAKKFIYGLLERNPDPEELRRFELHLEKCSACSGEYAAVRKVLDSTRKIQVPDPGEEYWAGFVLRLRKKIEEKTERRTVFSPFFKFLAAASAAALIVVAVLTFWPAGPQAPPPVTPGITGTETDVWKKLDERLSSITSDQDAAALQAFALPGVLDFSTSTGDNDLAIPEYVTGDSYDAAIQDYDSLLQSFTPQERQQFLEEVRKSIG
jgi:hypothetical protein